MSFWRQLKAGLRVLTNRKAADQDLADEVQDYLGEATAALVARGVDPEEARRTARLELGSATVLREEVRLYGWENVVGTLFADVCYGTRQLRNHPGFTIVGVLTLALGIGACTAIFSAVNPILFEPLPYPHAGRMMMIWYAGEDGSRSPQAFHTYRELAVRSHSFETLAVMKPWLPTMTGENQPERLEGQQVSANYFRTLGVSPVLGRDFQASDDVLNGPKVCGGMPLVETPRSSADKSSSMTMVIPLSASCHAHSRTSWLLRLKFGRRCSTTLRTRVRLTPGSGDIICEWLGGCEQASERIKRAENSIRSRATP